MATLPQRSGAQHLRRERDGRTFGAAARRPPAGSRREGQNKAIEAALERYGIGTSDVPPVVWTVFATGVSQALVMERALGMSSGHAETFKYCEEWLRRLEGEPLSADGGQPAVTNSE